MAAGGRPRGWGRGWARCTGSRPTSAWCPPRSSPSTPTSPSATRRPLGAPCATTPPSTSPSPASARRCRGGTTGTSATTTGTTPKSRGSAARPAPRWPSGPSSACRRSWPPAPRRAAPVRGALAIDPDSVRVPAPSERAGAARAAGGPAALARITTLHPTSYNEARTIGERYRDGIPVIMNLDRARRRVGQAPRRLRSRAGLRAPRRLRQGHQPGVPAHARRRGGLGRRRAQARQPRRQRRRGSPRY